MGGVMGTCDTCCVRGIHIEVSYSKILHCNFA